MNEFRLFNDRFFVGTAQPGSRNPKKATPPKECPLEEELIFPDYFNKKIDTYVRISASTSAEKAYFSNATLRIMKKLEARKTLKSACFKKSFDEIELASNNCYKPSVKPKAAR